MLLPRSLAVAPNLLQLDSTGSTNDELVARAATSADFSVVVTDDQRAGRGRLGRVWVAPPGKTLAISVLLRLRLPGGEPLSFEHFGWLPLIAGVAMARAVGVVVPAERVGLKWPNDVLVAVDGADKKVCGILAELVPTDGAVVIGAGINLTMAEDDLPTATSTSLALAGAGEADLADIVLSEYLRTLRELSTRFLAVGADAEASDIRSLVVENCTTLGRAVRVELPGGDELYGVATGIDRAGRLEVTATSDGRLTAVAAGDVTHLRYE